MSETLTSLVVLIAITGHRTLAGIYIFLYFHSVFPLASRSTSGGLSSFLGKGPPTFITGGSERFCHSEFDYDLVVSQ